MTWCDYWCRNEQKANAAAEEVRKFAANSQVHAFAADLSSMAQVRKLAENVKSAHPSIDVLSNNAGVFAERMQVNFLSKNPNDAFCILKPSESSITVLLIRHTSQGCSCL